MSVAKTVWEGSLAIVAGVAAAVGLAVATSLAARPQPEVSYAERAWADACRLSGYDCTGVAPPSIYVTSRVRTMLGAIGAYLPTTHTIFLDPELAPSTDLWAYAVVVHEMTHYLQWVRFGWGYPYADLFIACTMEEDAYRVSNALLVERGAFELQRLDWSKSYGCGE